MPLQTSFTGQPDFDRYLGLVPGDAILLIHPDRKVAAKIIGDLFRAAREGTSRPHYINRTGDWDFHLQGLPEAGTQGALRSSRGFAAGVVREAGRVKSGSTILTDDLSQWLRFIPGKGAVEAFLRDLSRAAASRRCVLIAPLLRTETRPALIAALKEEASVVVEARDDRGTIILHALALRGRYSPDHTRAFVISGRIASHGGQTRRAGLAGQAGKVGQVGIAEQRLTEFRDLSTRLLTGGFGGASTGLALAGMGRGMFDCNDALPKICNLSRESFLAGKITGPIAPAERRKFLRFLATALQGKHSGRTTVSLDRESGSPKALEVRSLPAGSGFTWFQVVPAPPAGDSPGRFPAGSLRELASLQDSFSLPLAVLDSRGIVSANGAFSRLRPGKNGRGPLSEVFSAGCIRDIRNAAAAVLRDRTSVAVSATLAGDPKGAVRVEIFPIPGVALGTPSGASSGAPPGTAPDAPLEAVQALVIDMAADAAALRSAEIRARTGTLVAELSPLASIFFSGDTVSGADQKAVGLFGYENESAMRALTRSILFDEKTAEALARAGAGNRAAKTESQKIAGSARKADGSLLPCSLVVRAVDNSAEYDIVIGVEDISGLVSRDNEAKAVAAGISQVREILETATGAADVETLLSYCLNKSLEVLGWRGGVLYLPSADGKSFEEARSKHAPRRLLEKIGALSADEGLGGYMAKTLEAHVFPISRYPSFLPFKSLFAAHGIGAVSFIPLVHHERITGIIIGLSEKEEGSGPGSVGILTILGKLIGNAMAGARRLATTEESEERLHKVLKAIKGVVYTASPEGTVRTIHEGVSALLGYKPSEFLRNPALFLSLIHEADKRILLERVTHGRELGETFVREYRMRPKARAGFRWIRDTVSVERSPGGEVVRFVGVLRDITDEREKLEALAADSTTFSAIRDSIPDGLAMFNHSMKVAGWNTQMELISGVEEKTALGAEFPAGLPLPEDGIEEKIRRVRTGREVVHLGVWEHPTASRSYDIHVFPVVSGEGESAGVCLRYSDISEYSAELKVLLRSQSVLRNVIDAMDDILLITDLAGGVLEVNRSFRRIMGYAGTEASGASIPYPWLVEDDLGRMMAWLNEIREQRWPRDFDVRWRTKRGEVIPLSLTTTLIRDSLGEPLAMLNVARDIGERVRLTEDLATRNSQIELLNSIFTVANQSTDIDPIFGTFVREAPRFIPARSIALYLPDHPDGPLWHSGLSGRSPELSASFERFTAAAAAAVRGSAGPTLFTDLNRDDRFRDLASAAGGFRTMLALPVGVRGEPLGALLLMHEEPHALSDQHVRFLRPLADQLGNVLERTGLFRRVSEDADYIRALLDSTESPLFTTDADLMITQTNRAADALLGGLRSPGETAGPGRRLFDFLAPGPVASALRDGIREVGVGGSTAAALECSLGGGPQEPGRTLRLLVNPLTTGGKRSGFVFSFADITALKQSELNLKHRTEQLLALHEISTRMITPHDTVDLLRSVLPQLLGVLDASAVLVYLTDSGGATLSLVHHEGLVAEKFASINILKTAGSVTGDAVTRKRAEYIASAAYDDPRIAEANREILRRGGLEAMAVIPLLSKDRAIGALDIFYLAPHRFSEEEKNVLALVGNQLGITIENARLYGELNAQIDRLTLLFDLSTKLTSTLHTGEVYRAVYDHVAAVLPGREFSVFAVDGAWSTLKFRVSGGEGGAVADAPRSPFPGSPAEEEAVRERRPCRDGRTGSLLIPMMLEGRIAGLILIDSDRAVDARDVRLLESVGNLGALALDKADLYEETVRISDEIARRNRELDDFTYVVSHDLKEPLISIEGFSRILQTDHREAVGAEGGEYLESLVGASTRMKGLIDDLLQLSRVSRPSESFTRVPLGEVIAEIRTDMEFVIRKKNVLFTVDPAIPDVMGNRSHLKILFRNLIGNAVKFNDKERPLVEIGFRIQGNNAYLFWVSDNGIGIEKDFFEKIFVIFQRLHPREEYEGSGAGLAIVKKIVEMHGGTIGVESEPGEGTRFLFTLNAPARSQS